MPWLVALAHVAAWVLAACAASGPRAPWPAAAKRHCDAGHAEVRTGNPGYRRTGAAVLVREIDRPTRANLDYAAYHANFMIADPPPEGGAGNQPINPDLAQSLRRGAGADSLTGSIRKTTLSDGGTSGAAGAGAAGRVAVQPVRQVVAAASRIWWPACAKRPGVWAPGPLARQTAALGYLHDPGAGKPVELWVKVEFQPWWKGFSDLPDEDGDGYPEIYGRAKDGTLGPEALALIAQDYAGKVLDAAEVASWAHKLASYWYPSYNTDLAPVGPRWPDAETEADDPLWSGRGQLRRRPRWSCAASRRANRPTTCSWSKAWAPRPARPALAGDKGKPRALAKGHATPQPASTAKAIEAELTAAGGSWSKWQSKLDKFHDELRRSLKATPAKVKGLPGDDGFLFYRNGLDYVTGGDLQKQPRGKNPLPVIVEWKKLLEKQGVDFLFVPVPDKIEIFPDKAGRWQSRAGAARAGRQPVRAQAAAGSGQGRGRDHRSVAPAAGGSPAGTGGRRAAVSEARHALDAARPGHRGRGDRRADQTLPLVRRAGRRRRRSTARSPRRSRATAICIRGCATPSKKRTSPRR